MTELEYLVHIIKELKSLKFTKCNISYYKIEKAFGNCNQIISELERKYKNQLKIKNISVIEYYHVKKVCIEFH